MAHATLLLCSVLLAAENAPAPLPADKAAADAKLLPGFHMDVVAAEPDLVQPVSFCIDHRGRFVVAEALNYGTWRATGKDRVVILEDTDGDGRADKRTVFHEGFNYITGVEVGFGGVWVMSPPCLYFVPDRDGDDKPDAEPQVVFDGFGHKESRHNLANGFNWGPDGWLYFGHGRTSPSEVGRPGTPADKRIHCDGGVCRIHPTKLVFENFADGTTNPWGVGFDEFGQCFVSNCVNPHLFHMIPGGHYEPWRNRPSSQFAYDRVPTVADHLHYEADKPKAMRGESAETLALGGGHAHCGTLVYLGDRFPAGYRNTVLMCNVHGRRVNNDVLIRKGSGYSALHGKDLMISADPWFMGVTLRTGPDGNLYVSDWSDTGECHTYKPHPTDGRIYRIRFGEPVRERVNLARFGDAELAKMQLHRNEWHVTQSRKLLQERAAKPGWDVAAVHGSQRAVLNSPAQKAPQRLNALWTLQVTGGIDVAGLTELLADRDEHVRGWAVRLLCESAPSPATLAKLTAATGDDSPAVRLELASALQRLSLEQRWNMGAGLLAHADDSDDANLPLMYWYGLEPLVGADPTRGLRLAAAGRIPLVRRYAARRLADDALARPNLRDLGPLATVLAETDDAVRVDLLEGTRDALRGRRSMPMPAGWSNVYPKLAASSQVRVRDAARALATLFGDPVALAELRNTALSTAAQANARRAALEALIEKRVSDLAPILHDLLADPAVRAVALRGLGSYTHGKTPERILAVYAQLPIEEKNDAVAVLASRKEYALELLGAVERGAVARAEISAFVARQIHALGDAKVSTRLREVWGEVRDASAQAKQQIAKYKGLLTPGRLQRADLSNGRLLFSKTCQQCHRLFGEGGKAGPDITGSNRANLDYILSNIVEPSAEIARDYRMSLIKMQDERIITGMIVERTAARITIETERGRVVLPGDEIAEVALSDRSMMPEGQLDKLTPDQIRDLIAYLASPRQVDLPKP